MRILRRILIAIVVALAILFGGVYWVAPVALSFYAAKTAPAVASVVPVDLSDKSISAAPGTKLSFFGYEFEVPWTDLDETKTALNPKDKADQTRVDLHFRSGLRLWVSVVPPRHWANRFAEMGSSPQGIEAIFGRETVKSDYAFVKALYEFTPEKMNHWALLQRGQIRDEFLLSIKSATLSRSAETGIFNVQNASFKGFQKGNPRVRQAEIIVDLYSDEGAIEMIFLQEDYRDYRGVTQPEINRIVQSLRKAPQDESPTARIAQK